MPTPETATLGPVMGRPSSNAVEPSASPSGASPMATVKHGIPARQATFHPDLFTSAELQELAAIREATTVRIVKGGGVVDTNADAAMLHPAVKRAIEIVAGPGRKVGWCMFVDTPLALAVHADTGSGDSFTDTMMIIPLDSVPQPPPGTVFFGQHWFGRSANFVKGTPDFPGKINVTVTNYDDLVGTTTEQFPEDVRERHLWHLRPQWLEGLSLHTVMPWTLHGAMSFPRSQLHCGEAMPKGCLKRSLIIRVMPLG